MGQYFKIVNLDKKQYLNPHKFSEGLKLLEFSLSCSGTLTALALLLADNNEQDVGSNNLLIGSWAGDRIIITGDYAENGRYWYGTYEGGQTQVPMNENLYKLLPDNFEDISNKILAVMNEAGIDTENATKSLRPDFVINFGRK